MAHLTQLADDEGENVENVEEADDVLRVLLEDGDGEDLALEEDLGVNWNGTSR